MPIGSRTFDPPEPKPSPKSHNFMMLEHEMSLNEDLNTKVKEIFQKRWTTRDGTVVPDPEDITLGNDAVKLDAAILYSDLKGSTKMVDSQTAEFAAEVYKAFLHCCGEIVREMGGEITAYDGDRIMAVFLGDDNKTNAATCALKINWAVKKVINPKIADMYGSEKYTVRHVTGVDATEIFVARTGVWGNNDLVWVGPAANYAAKLCELGSDGHSSYITDRVYDSLNKSAKMSLDRDMWESRTWTAMNGMTIYRSNFWWEV